MIILHAAGFEKTLLLWGERPVEGKIVNPARRGRKPKAARQARYPFDAGLGGLTSALQETGLGIKAGRGRGRTVAAWLPTCEDTPIPSSPLIAEPPESQAKTALAPWIINALPLTAEEIVELLCACAGKRTLAPGTVVGRDLAFWAQALGFAGALVARQQYLPGIEAREGQYRACWEPVFAGSDADRLADLAGGMPPVARTFADSQATFPPETPAIEALKGLVHKMVDHLVRSATPAQSSAVSPKSRRERAAFDSVHDHWLHALRAPDGAIEGAQFDLALFAAQVQAWRRPIAISTTSPFRLCFRLEEPDGDSEQGKTRASSSGSDSPAGGDAQAGKWYVRFLLQASDDPSLLLPIWDGRKARRGAAGPKDTAFNVHEYILASLGQAAGVCPRIEASLRTAQPSGYETDADGAHEFLTEKSIALEQAGFGVMLPAWWTRKGTKLRLTVRAGVKSPRMQGGSGLSLDEIVRFDWEVALGGEKLSPGELRALAALKAPLVKLRGQWVEMSAQEIRAALAFWEKRASDSATVRDIVQMAVGATEMAGGIALAGVTASGWIGEMLNGLGGDAAFEEQPAPQGFVGKLRPYQVRGYSWLSFLRRWGLGACLADDMGLGKTIQTLSLIQRDWESDGKRPVLLVCPTSVVNNWRREAARFTPHLPVMVHHGVERKKGSAFRAAAEKQSIVISSYALLHRDLEHLGKVDWAGVVLDEAQNIKNPETKQARAARSLASGYRIALTGTPVENNVGDLWSIMEFLNPGFLGAQARFKRDFFLPIQANRDPEAAQRLKRITGPFILRRLKTDRTVISDLPDKLEMKVFCALTKEQASLYAAVLKEAEETLESAEGMRRKGVILATLSKLKQVCNHPAQFLGDNSGIPGRSGKLARLSEMLEEILEVGDRALIFSQFSEMGEILRRHLQETFGREALFLHGGVPKKQRDRMVERFQSDAGPPVFILSLKAGGTGLNLTRASHVFHFDRWWNPAVEDQATDRAFRIGQMRNVQVHKFICAGTLEDKIDEMIEGKKAVAERVVSAGEGWLTELSDKELKNVFALRAEAVGE